jgi:hypothetical protein
MLQTNRNKISELAHHVFYVIVSEVPLFKNHNDKIKLMNLMKKYKR